MKIEKYNYLLLACEQACLSRIHREPQLGSSVVKNKIKNNNKAGSNYVSSIELFNNIQK